MSVKNYCIYEYLPFKNSLTVASRCLVIVKHCLLLSLTHSLLSTYHCLWHSLPYILLMQQRTSLISWHINDIHYKDTATQTSPSPTTTIIHRCGTNSSTPTGTARQKVKINFPSKLSLRLPSMSWRGGMVEGAFRSWRMTSLGVSQL